MFTLYYVDNSPACGKLMALLGDNGWLKEKYTFVDAKQVPETLRELKITQVPVIITYEQTRYDGEAALRFLLEQLKTYGSNMMLLETIYLRHEMQRNFDKVFSLLDGRSALTRPTPRMVEQAEMVETGSAEMEDENRMLKPLIVVKKAADKLDLSNLMKQRQSFNPRQG